MKFSQSNKTYMIKPIFVGLLTIIGVLVLGFNQMGATAAPADSIVGYVWQDLDADGIRDAGEPGLGNVTVNLLDGVGTPINSTTTFPTGDYIFSSLTTPGNYIIEFEIPTGSGYVFSPQGQGSDPLKDSDADIITGQTAVIALASGEGREGIDAGMHPPTSIGDRVWNDLNVNGIQDGGEPGLGGVDVNLFEFDGTPAGNTTTIFNGSYVFTGIPPGQYYVEFVLPAGFAFSPQGQGVPSADSDPDVGTGETAVFTATVGTSKDDIDAGLFQPATIGDRAWQDFNADGIQDIGEPGFPNVTVTLYDTNDAEIDNTITDPTGLYTFTNLIPDTYYLIFGIPTGFVASPQDQGGDDALDSDIDGTGRTANITVAFAEKQQDVDAGFMGTGTIGDFVWNDLNGNGNQDGGGEVGIDGVTVNLTGYGPDDTLGTGDDIVYPAQVTAGGGAYDFTGLPAGMYRVDIDESSAPLTGFVLTTANDPLDITITAGQDYNDADFGFQQQTASIGDFVWYDLNGDGVQDMGEPGIDGVTINLINSSNVVISTTTTAGGGAYDFVNLAAGNYSVDVTDTGAVLTGFGLTGGTDPHAVTLTAGQDYNAADFGYQQQDASIGDLVWNDVDGDTNQDMGEPGIDGVTVNLTGAGLDGSLDTGDDVTYPAQVTAGGGAYDFTGLPAGLYRVDVDENSTPLTGFVLTTGNDPLEVTITAGQDYNAADFGFRDSATASIGDFVWNDLNGNGVQDGGGEVGIDGVTVNLTGAGLDGTLDTGDDVTYPAQITAGGGAYDFTGLPAGLYRVDVDESSAPLTGFGLTTGIDPLEVTITAGQDYNAADFGFQQQDATIGDFIWNDLNGNGVQDGGAEVGIDGVTINLINSSNVVISTTTTAGGGAYDFVNLAAGNYSVDVTDTGAVLTGFGLTGGTDPHAVTITAGQDYNDADFGYQQQNASIGDLVWNDLNGDTSPVGEPGIDGVTVNLTGAGLDGALDTGDDVAYSAQVTAGGGAYDFTGLPAGLYRVDVDENSAPLTGFVLTTGNDPLEVTIAAGEDYNDADFGYQDPGNASIGDFVWNDLNGDGIQDVGEPGIDGITIDLINSSNVVISTTTTAGGGAYGFTNLVGGNYLVDVTDTGGVLTGWSLSGGTDPHAVTLAPSQNYAAADFGYRDPADATIGDLIWNDRDGNGTQDAGEPGLDGITVNLTGFGPDDTFGTGDDVVYPAQVTAGGGAYDFTGLPAGMYRIDVNDASLPSGVSLTGGTDPLDVTLGVSQDYNDADFGYQGNASIGDLVWADDNVNGVQDGGEAGLAGITIYVDLNNNSSRDNNEPLATSDGTGNYAITGLPAGVYAVDVDNSTAPTGYTLNTATPIAVTLAAGQSFVDADFAFVEGFEVYLPVILNNFQTIVAPDLVVTSVAATNDEVQVVIENQGNAATGAGFWVDFYVNPSEAPTHANQLWQDLGSEGIAWGITIPIAAGESLTLTYSTASGAPNLYYSAADSNFTGTMSPGTSVYAQVDSAHLNNANGAILETHEITGDPYNNVSSEVFSTAVGANMTTVNNTSNDLHALDAKFDLPLR